TLVPDTAGSYEIQERRGASPDCREVKDAAAEMVFERPPAASGGSPPHEGENVNLPLVRGRRERSERGGRSNTILNAFTPIPYPSQTESGPLPQTPLLPDDHRHRVPPLFQ